MEFFNNIGLFGNVLSIIVSIAFLYYGAEWLVNGGSYIARHFGVPNLVIGLTIVAFGTSLPEFVVSFVANIFEDSPTMAIGNIIGSNITNIGLILGLSALILPMAIMFSRIYGQLLFLFSVGLLLYVLSLDGVINRWEGIAMTLILIGYVVYLYRHPDNVETDGDKETIHHSVLSNIGLLAVGVTVLSGGAWLFVQSGQWFAYRFGVPELVIGMTVMAVGTSLPELATSLVAAIKKQGEISIGNIIGSNIFNILFVMGGVSIVKPLRVLETRTVQGVEESYFPHYHYWVMLFFGLILLPMMWKSKLGRLSGIVLILGYFGFYTYLFLDL